MAVQISGNDITVPRDGSFTRNVTIGGTLTYEDVTNIDSVGLVTARTGIEIGARPGVAASISVDGNAIFSGITTATTLRAPTGIVTTLTTNTLTANSTAKVGSGVTLSPDGDVFVTGVGEIFNWIWVALVAVIILNVILRYIFKSGMIELEELQWHLYAIGWLVGLSSTYIVDQHVRVDVLTCLLYTSPSPRD